MKIKYLALAAATAAALASTQASAQAFYINYTAVDNSFTAHLTGNATNGVATSIFGDRNGVSVTGLSSYAGATQNITGTFPYTDFGGISYTAGGIDYNFYANGANFETNSVIDPNGFGPGVAIAPLSVTAAVPEPATWAMMLVGFGMVGFGLRSRRNGKVTTKVAFA